MGAFQIDPQFHPQLRSHLQSQRRDYAIHIYARLNYGDEERRRSLNVLPKDMRLSSLAHTGASGENTVDPSVANVLFLSLYSNGGGHRLPIRGAPPSRGCCQSPNMWCKIARVTRGSLERNVSPGTPSPALSLIRPVLGGMWEWDGERRLGSLRRDFWRVAITLGLANVPNPLQC